GMERVWERDRCSWFGPWFSFGLAFDLWPTDESPRVQRPKRQNSKKTNVDTKPCAPLHFQRVWSISPSGATNKFLIRSAHYHRTGRLQLPAFAVVYLKVIPRGPLSSG